MQRKRTMSSFAGVVPKKRRRTRAPARRPAVSRILGRTSITEIKSFDCVNTGVAILPAPGAIASAEPGVAFAGITELNCIPQGATVANRIGNKVVIKSIHYRAHLNAAAGTVGVVRLMIVRDNQPNGAFPAATDILLNQPAGALTGYSGVNIANKSRFAVLRDGFYPIDQAQSLVHQVNLYIKGRFDTEFGGNAGTIADLRTGSLLLVCFLTMGLGNITLSDGVTRIRYWD